MCPDPDEHERLRGLDAHRHDDRGVERGNLDELQTSVALVLTTATPLLGMVPRQMTEALSLAGRRHSCSVIRSERSGASSDRRSDTSPHKQFQLVTRITWSPSQARGCPVTGEHGPGSPHIPRRPAIAAPGAAQRRGGERRAFVNHDPVVGAGGGA